jgi:hypothetical protein
MQQNMSQSNEKVHIAVTREEREVLHQAMDEEFGRSSRLSAGAYIRLLANRRLSELEGNA